LWRLNFVNFVDVFINFINFIDENREIHTTNYYELNK